MTDQINTYSLVNGPIWRGGSGSLSDNWITAAIYDTTTSKYIALVYGGVNGGVSVVAPATQSSYITSLDPILGTGGTMTGSTTVTSMTLNNPAAYTLSGSITSTGIFQQNAGTLTVTGAVKAQALDIEGTVLETGGSIAATSVFVGGSLQVGDLTGAAAQFTAGSVGLSGTGTVLIQGAATQASCDFRLNSGSVTLAGGATVVSNAVQGGYGITNSDSKPTTLTVTGAGTNLTAQSTLSIDYDGYLNVEAGASASFSGTVQDYGTTTVRGANSRLSLGAGATLSGFGLSSGATVLIKDGGVLSVAGSTPLNAGCATVTVDGAGSALNAVAASFQPAYVAGQNFATQLTVSNGGAVNATNFSMFYALSPNADFSGGYPVYQRTSSAVALAGGTITANSIDLEGGAKIAGYGTLTGSVTANGGAIIASGGTLTLAGTYNPGLVLSIDAGSTLVLPQAETGGVAFNAATGTLALGTPASFFGTITEFQSGDVVDLLGATANDSRYNTSTGKLTLYNASYGTGAAPVPVATLLFSGTAAQSFALAADGAGGTKVTAGVAPPSVYTLAIAANDAYFGITRDGDYHQFDSRSNPAIGFYAQALEDGNQVIVAIRGTNPYNWSDLLFNLTADASWALGIPADTLTLEVIAAADFLKQVRQERLTDQITITGHSLGGAIAQLLGQASGDVAVTFNAPGAAQLVNGLTPALLKAAQTNDGLGGTVASTNYRTFGDQISLLGTPIGTQVTVASPYPDDWNNWLNNHSMTALQYQIGRGAAQTVGKILDGKLPYSQLGRMYASSVAGSVLSFLVSGITGENTQLSFDPSNYATTTLVANAGSPAVTAIDLPASDGVSTYSVSFLVNGTWLAPVSVKPGVSSAVPGAGATGVQFTALDASRAPVGLPSGSLFTATFPSAGTFSGTLTESNPQGTIDTLLLQNTNGAIVAAGQANLVVTGAAPVANPGPTWHVMGSGDFNGDGQMDILLENNNGAVVDYLMVGTSVATVSTLGSPGASWHVRGTADFNADGQSDILLQNDNGNMVVWNTNGYAVTGAASIGFAPAGWTAEAVADFDGDGHPDVLVQNTNGSLVDYLLNGTTITAANALGNPGVGWAVTGTGDYNGDGKADILLHNDNGTNVAWETNGTSITNSIVVDTTSPAWTGTVAGVDLNGDGATDLVVQNKDSTIVGFTTNGAGTVTAAAQLAAPGVGWHTIGNDPMQFIDGTQAAGGVTATPGMDQFDFTSSTSGSHPITGFDPAQDSVAFSSALFPSYAAMEAHEAPYAGGTLIALSLTANVVIQGVAPGQLDSSNFVFR